jgi:hypothetical protein
LAGVGISLEKTGCLLNSANSSRPQRQVSKSEKKKKEKKSNVHQSNSL